MQRGPIEPHFGGGWPESTNMTSLSWNQVVCLHCSCCRKRRTSAFHRGRSLHHSKRWCRVLQEPGWRRELSTCCWFPNDIDSLRDTVCASACSPSDNADLRWGALYALETLSQLIEYDFKMQAHYVHNAPIIVEDEPRFTWRGTRVLKPTVRHHYFIRCVDWYGKSFLICGHASFGSRCYVNAEI